MRLDSCGHCGARERAAGRCRVCGRLVCGACSARPLSCTPPSPEIRELALAPHRLCQVDPRGARGLAIGPNGELTLLDLEGSRRRSIELRIADDELLPLLLPDGGVVHVHDVGPEHGHTLRFAEPSIWSGLTRRALVPLGFVPRSLALSASGGTVLASGDGELEVIDAASRRSRGTVALPAPASAVAASERADRIVTAYQDAVRCYRLSDLAPAEELPLQVGDVTWIGVGRDTIVVLGAKGRAVFRNWRGGWEERDPLPPGMGSAVRAGGEAALDDEGLVFACRGADVALESFSFVFGEHARHALLDGRARFLRFVRSSPAAEKLVGAFEGGRALVCPVQAGTVMATPPRPQPNWCIKLLQQFHRYWLEKQLHRGELSELFRARVFGAAGFSNVLVVRRLLPEVAADPLLVDLLRQASLCSAHLNHQNIVQTFDIGSVGGVEFIAQEYVQGLDLGRLLRALESSGVAFPVGIALRVIIEICRGLAYAHQSLADRGSTPSRPVPFDGIAVHGVIDPGKVLISLEGTIKLSGWFRTAEARLRRGGAAPDPGKVCFWAPEVRARGPLDARSDIYSAGALLLRMLAPTALAAGHPYRQSLPVTIRGDLIPARVAAIIERAAAPDPTLRFPRVEELGATCREAGEALGALLDACDLGDWLQREVPHLLPRHDPAEVPAG